MAEQTDNPCKPHYNISMSRRTRRPNNLKIEACESTCLGKEENAHRRQKHEDHQQQKSLKELIQGRCPLAQHFEVKEEEKQQDPVISRNENGVKFKKIVKHCVDVMSNLIKVKQDPPVESRKKPIGSLTFVKQK
ncbi:uncharacterized protein LOC111383713 [Olea europaea var. sylvestris]|uniref:uncharacterized protein LOC111383713 n=1 Tax=Olea europaea var. sylvestris TaxID=158386 RepID=UPI000C1D4397|nr:uncharacterized protein LOC111383713 [Olea europaea var. sylvestris]